MERVIDFIDAAGRAEFTQETGYSAQVISRAIVENVMPSSWFINVRDFCERRQMEVPEHLFRWSGVRVRSPKLPRSEGS